MEEKQSALGILGILREAFQTTIKNWKLVLSIAFFMFIYYYPFVCADHLILARVCYDFASDALKHKDVSLSEVDPKLYKAYVKDVRPIVVFRLITLAVYSLILMTSLSAVVHSTHEAYTAKVISFKEMLLSTRARWKRPLITTIWMVLISLGSAALFFFAFGLIAVMTDGSILISLKSGLIIFGSCFCFYLSAVWILSLVVSVLEENSSGLKAIDRATDLMKGKRLQGCLLMLILILASLAISGTFVFLANHQKSGLIWVAISIPRIWLFCLKKLFVFIVFTMFYHECKGSHAVEDKRSVYVPLSTVEV